MTHRVARHNLTPDLNAIASFKVLERRNPHTGAIANGSFYFMANTNDDP